MDRRTIEDLRAAVAVRSLLLQELGLWARQLNLEHRLILASMATTMVRATAELSQNPRASELMREAVADLGVHKWSDADCPWSDEEAKS